MKRIKKIIFVYEDDTSDMIDDSRACALFQSRCNSSGILSGMEEYVVPAEEVKDAE